MRSARLALVPAVLLTAACFQGQGVVKINADGSGSVVDTGKFGEQAKGMMAAMEEMDKSTPAQKKAKKEASYKEKGTAMGLTYVSMETIPDGSTRTTYSFKDVTTVPLPSALIFTTRWPWKQAAVIKTAGTRASRALRMEISFRGPYAE